MNPKDKIGRQKPQLHLLPPRAMVDCARALEDGARKYGAWNWRSTKVAATVYLSAALRHMLAYLDGEFYDPDSGHPHLGHAMASLAILLDAHAGGWIIDDRPRVKGPGPKAVRERRKK